MRNLFKIFSFTLSLLGSTALYAQQSITIEDAWIRAVPPTSKVTAAYMKIYNHTDSAIDLLSGSTTAFQTVELHQTVFEGEMAKMVKQEKITIPAQGMTALKPGDYHVMLIDRQVELKTGDSVELTLQFSDESSQSLNIEVKQSDMSMMQHHHKH